MLHRFVAGLIFSCVFGSSAFAGWKEPRESLDQSYAFRHFRIFYTLKGPNAFPGDVAEHERALLAPGYLEALAQQLNRADEEFKNALGLRTPLSGPRYLGATSIDVHILSLQGNSGSTGDEIHVFNYRHFKPSPAALTIALSNRWQPGNKTPVHELFHAYQYGYTLFKTAWFLEGMARSSESVLSVSPRKQIPLPQGVEELGEVVRRSYGAASLWNRIAEHCGVRIFGDILSAYERIDQEISRERGFKSRSWPEVEQRSTRNTPYLLRGLLNALDDHCAGKGGSELERFKTLLRTESRTAEAATIRPVPAPR